MDSQAKPAKRKSKRRVTDIKALMELDNLDSGKRAMREIMIKDSGITMRVQIPDKQAFDILRIGNRIYTMTDKGHYHIANCWPILKEDIVFRENKGRGRRPSLLKYIAEGASAP